MELKRPIVGVFIPIKSKACSDWWKKNSIGPVEVVWFEAVLNYWKEESHKIACWPFFFSFTEEKDIQLRKLKHLAWKVVIYEIAKGESSFIFSPEVSKHFLFAHLFLPLFILWIGHTTLFASSQEQHLRQCAVILSCWYCH